MISARTFPCVPESVGAARAFVARTLEDPRHPDLVDNAVLLVSELATNAVTHAATSFTVAIATNSRVRVEVIAPGPVEPMSTHGRGLAIVAQLADRWGVEPLANGKRVWWEVDA